MTTKNETNSNDGRGVAKDPSKDKRLKANKTPLETWKGWVGRAQGYMKHVPEARRAYALEYQADLEIVMGEKVSLERVELMLKDKEDQFFSGKRASLL